ncbi:site-specific integrase [Caballeronia sp. SBC2]|uniref:site-specific integrase n=1 Tax=Caballeronia sp. SBC2 TaxID=2705547 RepID=UPI0013E1C0E7|nr:site-specific integrase [Caballeronia sp. SBC2]QIE22613.1 hypothetical protein SBC2_06230 [Caballeronia sp. SBC2]
MAAEFLQRSRHGTVFMFRRRIPLDLVPTLGRTHFYRSLATADFRLASTRARFLAGACDAFFEKVRDILRSGLAQDAIQMSVLAQIEFPVPSQWPATPLFKGHPSHEAASQTLTAILASKVQGPKIPIVKAVTLDSAVETYLAQIAVKPATLVRYRTILGRLVDHFGRSYTLALLNQDKFVEFADSVNASPEMATKTKQVTITAAATFVNWHAARNSGLPRVVSGSLKPKRTAPSWSDRAEFSLDEMAAIFDSVHASRNSSPAQFWVTVGCALTGCRLEELAQLDLASDLKRHTSGLWYLDINERPDADGVVRKSVKKLSSWRVVPVHPLLVEIGFVDFLQTQRANASGRPFASHWAPHGSTEPEPGVTRADIKWSHKISKWGGHRLQKLRRDGSVASDSATYFHSMRHTFITTLARAGVPEPLRAALTGHDNGGINGQTYTKFKDDPTSTFDVLVTGSEPLSTVLRNSMR